MGLGFVLAVTSVYIVEIASVEMRGICFCVNCKNVCIYILTLLIFKKTFHNIAWFRC